VRKGPGDDDNELILEGDDDKCPPLPLPPLTGILEITPLDIFLHIGVNLRWPWNLQMYSLKTYRTPRLDNQNPLAPQSAVHPATVVIGVAVWLRSAETHANQTRKSRERLPHRTRAPYPQPHPVRPQPPSALLAARRSIPLRLDGEVLAPPDTLEARALLPPLADGVGPLWTATGATFLTSSLPRCTDVDLGGGDSGKAGKSFLAVSHPMSSALL